MLSCELSVSVKENPDRDKQHQEITDPYPVMSSFFD